MRVPLVFHVDMDAFYASIEQRDRPELRGRAVIVGGSGPRAVVSACSYEARPFGVHSAMPVRKALRLCPSAIVVPVDMRRYVAVSRELMQLLAEYTPEIQAISVDEAFLDMTGTERLLGDPEQVARGIKERIRHEFALTVSVGIGPSRFIAKLASEADKPDGLYRVQPGSEADFVLGLRLSALWGLGKKSLRRLEALGIGDVAALRAARREYLHGHFGSAHGDYLYAIARGRDPGIYHRGAAGSTSISAERTFDEDVSDRRILWRMALDLAEEVFLRHMGSPWPAKTITIKFRYPPFETHNAQVTRQRPAAGYRELADQAFALFTARWSGQAIRLFGLGVSGRSDERDPGQGELFEQPTAAIEPTVAALRRKFGYRAIHRGGAGDQHLGMLRDEEADGGGNHSR